MASDRWRENEPTTSSASSPTDKPKRSNGINPSSFYKNHLNHDKLTPTERRIETILHSVAHSEIVQKRSEYTAVQKVQRESYHAVTSFKTFPLQDLAMDYLFSMMKQYLGDDEKSVDHPGLSMQKDFFSGNDLQASPLNNIKRRKLRQYPDRMNDLMEKYIKSFLAENRHDPPTENDNKQEIQNSKGHAPCRLLPELWSMEPRIFALETSSSGKRKYIVGQLGRFLQHYWRDSDPHGRHYYELIREGAPCRLYFDLEFCKRANPHITSEDSEFLMTEFIQELCSEIRIVHAIQIDRSCIVDLDSSTDKKFSRHLVVHLPIGELFADACATGVFVKNFVGRLAEEVSTGVLAARCVNLAKHLFVNSQASNTNIASRPLDLEETTQQKVVAFDAKKTTCFVDLGVYTRNRLFRLMGSTKFGKNASAALRIANANEFQFPTDFGNNNFYLTDQKPADITPPRNSNHDTINRDATTCNQRKIRPPSMSQDHDAFCAALDWETHARALAMTLVVPANASKANTLVLGQPKNDGLDSNKAPVSRTIRRHKSSSRSCNGDSPILMLDKFVLELTKRGGIQGKIRAWSMECTSNDGKPDSHYMSYQMSDNRWCENIGRAHRSNNIIWNVDLTRKTYWQTCHDPECRAANFRGRMMQLPEATATDVNDYLLDRELAELDEDKVIRDATNPPNEEFDDDEFDEALGNLDMSLMTPKCGRRSHSKNMDFIDSEFDEALGDLDMTLFTPTSGTAK